MGLSKLLRNAALGVALTALMVGNGSVNAQETVNDAWKKVEEERNSGIPKYWYKPKAGESYFMLSNGIPIPSSRIASINRMNGKKVGESVTDRPLVLTGLEIVLAEDREGRALSNDYVRTCVYDLNDGNPFCVEEHPNAGIGKMHVTWFLHEGKDGKTYTLWDKEFYDRKVMK